MKKKITLLTTIMMLTLTACNNNNEFKEKNDLNKIDKSEITTTNEIEHIEPQEKLDHFFEDEKDMIEKNQMLIKKLNEYGYDTGSIKAILCYMYSQSKLLATAAEGDYALPEAHASMLDVKDANRDSMLAAYDTYCNVFATSNMYNNNMSYMYNDKVCCGIGLMQWTGKKAISLIQFASDNDKCWYDYEIQVTYLNEELERLYVDNPDGLKEFKQMSFENALNEFIEKYTGGGKNALQSAMNVEAKIDTILKEN